jgi:hypothetical protein
MDMVMYTRVEKVDKNGNLKDANDKRLIKIGKKLHINN